MKLKESNRVRSLLRSQGSWEPFLEAISKGQKKTGSVLPEED
jgi:hypothetical protein